jgi:hypothetical protein
MGKDAVRRKEVIRSFFLPFTFFTVRQESISPTFYWRNCANILAQIKSLTSTASTKKLRAKLLYEKGARIMLVKLTPDRRRRRNNFNWDVILYTRHA